MHLHSPVSYDTEILPILICNIIKKGMIVYFSNILTTAVTCYYHCLSVESKLEVQISDLGEFQAHLEGGQEHSMIAIINLYLCSF